MLIKKIEVEDDLPNLTLCPTETSVITALEENVVFLGGYKNMEVSSVRSNNEYSTVICQITMNEECTVAKLKTKPFDQGFASGFAYLPSEDKNTIFISCGTVNK